MSFLSIFEVSGPKGQKLGPETKIFQSLRNQDPKIYISLKFGVPTLKNEKFQILAIFEKLLKNFQSLYQKCGL